MKYFTMEELTCSATARAQGLDNTPTPGHRANLETAAAMLLDPLRGAWAVECVCRGLGAPAIEVTSGYRGFRLNAAVGGAQTSAHCVGYAFDLVPQNGWRRLFRDFCREWLTGGAAGSVGPMGSAAGGEGAAGGSGSRGSVGRAFDQLISEDEDAAGIPRWIHIGYMDRQGRQRGQMLSMRGGKYGPMTK